MYREGCLDPSHPSYYDDIEENYFSDDESLEKWEKQLEDNIYINSDYDTNDSWFEDKAELFSGLDENYIPYVTAKPRKSLAPGQLTRVKHRSTTYKDKEPGCRCGCNTSRG